MKIGDKFYHRTRQENCVFTEDCAFMQMKNPDGTSIFMEFGNSPDLEILEVTRTLLDPVK